MDQVENYFKKKNIDVSLNTLGGNQRLIDLFISETKHIVDKAHNKTSNTVKSECYDLYYKMDKRTKYTGFEKFNSLDKTCRQKMSQKTKGLVGEALEAQEDKNNVTGSYIQELKNSFKNFKNPLLYLSGGIDSEFVASALLEEKISFTPVIFEWANDEGKILNIHDILYAMDFCSTHNLEPIVRTLNIEKLWNNPDFIDLAIETNNSSPHVNTYVYMIEMMAEEYKDSTHVLGGEVRFSRITEGEKIANYVTLAKVNPPSYNTQSYTLTYEASPDRIMGPGGQISLGLLYSWNGNYANNQNWNLSIGLTNPPPGGYSPTLSPTTPITDTWFLADLPGGTGFQYRRSTDGGTTWSPDWTTISDPLSIIISQTLATPGDQSATTGPITYTIQVKNISAPVIVVQSTITINIVYNYTPAWQFFSAQNPLGFSTPWFFPFSPLNSNIDTIGYIVFGGGGGGGGAYADPGDGSSPFRASAGGGAGSNLTTLSGNIVNYGTVAWSGATTTNSISISVGSGGAGGTGNNDGSNGINSYITINGTTYYGYGGGGGKAGNGPNLFSYGGGNNFNPGGGFTGGSSSYDGSNSLLVYGGGGAGAASNGGNASASSVGIGGTGSLVQLSKDGKTYYLSFGSGGAGGQPGTPNPAGNGAFSGNAFPLVDPTWGSSAGGNGGVGATATTDGVTTGSGTGGNGSAGWVAVIY